MTEALGVIGGHAQCDEVLLFCCAEHAEDAGVSHGWFRAGSAREPNFNANQFKAACPWAAMKLTQRKPIVCNALEELPAEAGAERAYLASVGLEACIIMPLHVDDQLTGMLFVQCFNKRAWPERLVQQLNLTAAVLVTVIQRKSTDQMLKRQSTLVCISDFKGKRAAQNAPLQHEVDLQIHRDEIVGSSPVFLQALAQAEQVAPLDSTVLIQGETGTGKELVANLIHKRSQRADKKMVRVNCAALPAALIEAELFGREKGAYTGAASKQIGRFELANGSSVFLDEIGELPLELQAKLLRVLQDGEFERLGSTKSVKVDVRVIAATNRDLDQRVAAGEFREDLYYRLNVFPITVPPLRERRLDIPALVWHFVREYGETMGKPIDRISKSTMKQLQGNAWPGNVRELRNVIERAMILSTDGTLTVQSGNGDYQRSTGQTLAEIETGHIRAILAQTNWRIRGDGGAAQILDMNPCTLESRMKKLGIKRPKRGPEK